MPRLTSPTGVTVNVSDEKAEVLRSIGYKGADEKKAPAKRTAAKAKSDKK